MDLLTLRTYVTVARTKSVTEASRHLHLTQPAVSLQIRRLEDSLGETLFDRSGRGMKLTAAGTHLLPRAEEVLRSADSLEAAARDYRGIHSGSLSIGTTDVASIHVLPRTFRKFNRRYPGIELSVQVEGTRSLISSLRAGDIEIAIVALPVAGDDLVSRAVGEDRLVAILPRRHPLSDRKRIRLEELAGTPMITFKEESVTRTWVSETFRREGLNPTIAMEISSPEAIKKLVEVGLGFAFLPERTVHHEIRDGRLSSPSVAGVRLIRKIGALRVSDRYLSPAAEAFLDLLPK